MAIVDQVREKKRRFREVVHELSMGIAKREARGRVMGERSEARAVTRDIFEER